MKILNAPYLVNPLPNKGSGKVTEPPSAPLSSDSRSSVVSDIVEDGQKPLLSSLQRIIHRFVDDVESYRSVRGDPPREMVAGIVPEMGARSQGKAAITSLEVLTMPPNALPMDQATLSVLPPEGNESDPSPETLGAKEIQRVAAMLFGGPPVEPSVENAANAETPSGSAVATMVEKLGRFLSTLTGGAVQPPAVLNVETDVAIKGFTSNEPPASLEEKRGSGSLLSSSGVPETGLLDLHSFQVNKLLRAAQAIGDALRANGIPIGLSRALEKALTFADGAALQSPVSIAADKTQGEIGAETAEQLQPQAIVSGIPAWSGGADPVGDSVTAPTTPSGLVFETSVSDKEVSGKAGTAVPVASDPAIPPGTAGLDGSFGRATENEGENLPPVIGNGSGMTERHGAKESAHSEPAMTDRGFNGTPIAKTFGSFTPQKGLVDAGFGETLAREALIPGGSASSAEMDPLVNRVVRFVDEINGILGGVVDGTAISIEDTAAHVSDRRDQVPLLAGSKMAASGPATQKVMGRIFGDEAALRMGELAGISLKKDGLLHLNLSSLASQLSSDKDETIGAVKDFGSMLSQRIDYFANPFISLYMDDKNVLQLKAAQKDESASLLEKEQQKELEGLEKRLNELQLLIGRSQLLQDWFSGRDIALHELPEESAKET